MATRAEIEQILKLRDEVSKKLTTLNTRVAKYEDNAKKGEKATREWAGSLKNAATRITGLNPAMLGLAGAVTAVIGGVFKATKDTINLGSSLVDLQSKTGLSIQELQELRFASEQAGVGFEQTSAAVLRLGRRAAAELPETTKFLKQLDLSVQDIVNRNPGEAFQLVAERIAQIPSPAQQAAAAMGVFGDAGLQVLPLINQGVSENIARFRELDVAMSEGTAFAAKDLADRLTDLNAKWTDIKTSIGGAVIPALQGMLTPIDSIKESFQLLGAFAITMAADVVEVFSSTMPTAVSTFLSVLALMPGKTGEAMTLAADAVANFAEAGKRMAETMREDAIESILEVTAPVDVLKESVDKTAFAFGEASVRIGKVMGDLRLLPPVMVGTLAAAEEFQAGFGDVTVGVGDLTFAMQSAFSRFGLQTRAELDATMAQAVSDFEFIKASGQFTAEELARIWKMFEDQRREMSIGTAETTVAMDKQALEGSSQILGQFASRNKAAAIAKATIDTILAVQRTFAQLGWPAGIPGMAIAAAIGAINVGKIAAQPASFKHGTPDLDFQDFGREKLVALHEREAVVPQGGGHRLAGEIAGAMATLPGGGGGGMGELTVNNNIKISGALVGTVAELEPIISEATIRGLRDNPRLRQEVDKRAKAAQT